jgi:hypothetical protein
VVTFDLVEQVVKGLEGGRNPRVIHRAKNNVTERGARSPGRGLLHGAPSPPLRRFATSVWSSGRAQ